jgi:hypothetical protein
MTSPFENTASKSIVMYLEPYLNRYYKYYQNIVTLSGMPDGPLAEMVTTVSAPKLSPFQEASPFNNNPHNCTYVLLRYPKSTVGGSQKRADIFMGTDDIPSIFGYLRTQGYSIDNDLTKMMNTSRVEIGGVSEMRFSGDRKMICMFYFNNPSI